MPFLFSYGSNHPGQLAERLGHPVKGAAAYASGWIRVFRGYSSNWGGSVATLLPKKSGKTYGYIAKVSEADLQRLDQFEGARYARTPITVTTHDGKEVKAIAYLRKGDEPFVEPPSQSYLEAVAKTVSAFWSDDEEPITAASFPIR